MEPDSKERKAADDRRRLLTEGNTRSVDALQAKLFAKALVDLGLTKYSVLASDRSHPT